MAAVGLASFSLSQCSWAEVTQLPENTSPFCLSVAFLVQATSGDSVTIPPLPGSRPGTCLLAAPHPHPCVSLLSSEPSLIFFPLGTSSLFELPFFRCQPPTQCVPGVLGV